MKKVNEKNMRCEGDFLIPPGVTKQLRRQIAASRGIGNTDAAAADRVGQHAGATSFKLCRTQLGLQRLGGKLLLGLHRSWKSTRRLQAPPRRAASDSMAVQAIPV